MIKCDDDVSLNKLESDVQNNRDIINVVKINFIVFITFDYRISPY